MSGWNPHQKAIAKACLADFQYLIDHQLLEHYVSERPYEQPTRHQVIELGHRFDGDCTSTIKLVLCDWHGIKPFDGQPLGYGNTQSFFEGPRVWHVPFSPKYWQPLDIVLYKNHPGRFRGGSDEHATILTRKVNGVWHVCSMGTDDGPTDHKWNYRPDAVAVIRVPIPLK